jgi:nucleoside-triphosphatase
MVAGRVLLLTGVPGIGKTTVIRYIADRLKERKLGGFYTEEIREHGVRRGFRLVGFDGIERVIAHVDFPKVHRVGKYGVDVGQIDEAADRLTHGPADVYLIDEIGKMECLSDRFVSRMRILLDGRQPVIATVARHGSGFIEEVKRGKGAVVLEVTHANRDTLAVQVLKWLMEGGRGD